MIYILTGKKSGVKIVFKYDLKGLLKTFEVDGEITEDQLHYLFWNEKFPFPYKESFIADINKMAAFDIKKVEEDLSFERFWKQYDYKISKKKTEKLWEKLSKAKRIKVFEHLPRYRAFVARKGIEMKYPDTYLRNETWEDIY